MTAFDNAFEYLETFKISAFALVKKKDGTVRLSYRVDGAKTTLVFA